MKVWIKRYAILTICLILFALPVLLILVNSEVFKDSTFRLITYIVLGVGTVLYYAIMSYFMLRKRK